jgi:hypothetical protein
MKKLILITLGMVFMLTGISAAGEITLKKNFFTGWKFSTDGQHYKNVGRTGKSLRLAMEGNELAQGEVDIYKKRMTLAAVTGWPGGFLVGWSIGDAIFGEWDSTNEILLAIGLPLGIVSTVAEVSGNKHLKKGVSIYNGEEQTLLLDMNYKKSALTGNSNLIIAINFTF